MPKDALATLCVSSSDWPLAVDRERRSYRHSGGLCEHSKEIPTQLVSPCTASRTCDYLYGRLQKITDDWRSRVADYSVMLGGGVHMVDLMLWLTGQRPTRQERSFNNRPFRELNSRQLTRRKIRGLPNEITPLPQHRPTADTAAYSIQPAHVGCCQIFFDLSVHTSCTRRLLTS